MSGYTVRGLPRGLARDAWWIAADSRSGATDGIRHSPVVTQGAFALLTGLIVLIDVLLWRATAPGLSLVVVIVVLAAAAQFCLSHRLSRHGIMMGWAGIGLGVLPLVEVVQPLSIAFAIGGLLHFVARVLLDGGPIDSARLGRAVGRFVVLGHLQTARDILATPKQVNVGEKVRGIPFAGLFTNWALPVGLGGVFLILLMRANPILAGWVSSVTSLAPATIGDLERVLFWVFSAVAVWPFLRLAPLRARMVPPLPLTGHRSVFRLPHAVLNAASLWRALIGFNLIFALQTAMDMTYLWGGARLPDGLTYAEYAHRGAYPLIATALLAGLFALLAQPFLPGRKGLKALLYLWVAQNVALTLSALLRLDLYVQAYGLTYLRFAAMIWMGLVAAGLVAMIWQMARVRSITWLVWTNAAMTLGVLYVLCFVNVAGIIATYNLDRHPRATHYVCMLGEGADAAIIAHERRIGYQICRASDVTLAAPDGWRDWGYRNWRLRRNLTGEGSAT